MSYGGPRVAFYIQRDWDNYADRIRKEDNARVQAHFDNIHREEEKMERDRKSRLFHQERLEEQARLEAEHAEYQAILEERRIREERQRTGKPPPKKMTPAEKAAIAYNISRTKELAVPKTNPQPAYGGMMYGRCMYQKTRKVEFPQGRAGQSYCPGVDRDRIIPQRPNPKDLPPWIGSYSSHHSILSEPMRRKAAEEEEDYYYRDAPQHTEEEKRARRRVIDAMLQRMEHAESEEIADDLPVPSQETSSGDPSRQDFPPAWGAMDDDTPSIFSHADSNGPIVATGAQHLKYDSSRAEVDSHLKRYGGSMTAPRPPYAPDVFVKDMNLPELQDRVVALQRRPKKILTDENQVPLFCARKNESRARK